MEEFENLMAISLNLGNEEIGLWLSDIYSFLCGNFLHLDEIAHIRKLAVRN